MRRSIQIVSLGLAAVVAGCGKPDAPAATSQPRETIDVSAASVQRLSIDETVELIGSLYGQEEVVISARVPGRIAEMKADVGDRIAGGALLAQIDPIDYQLALQQTQRSLDESLATLGLTQLPGNDFDAAGVPTVLRADVQSKNAQAKLDRARSLYEQTPPLISTQDFTDLQTQFEVSRRDYDAAVLEAKASLATAQSRAAQLDTARETLAKTRILTPEVAGQAMQWGIASRSVSAGEFVQTGTALFRLVADSTIKLRASVPERFAAKIQLEQPVTIQVESIGEAFKGVVKRISPAIDLKSRTFLVEAEFDNSSRQLRPGAFARAQVVVGASDNVAAVPATAIYSFAGIDRVYAVTGDKAKAIVVTRLGVRGDLVLIRGPLENVTQVAASELGRLSDGQPIRITPKQ